MHGLHTRTTIAATEAQRAAVAELTTATESPFGRPPFTITSDPNGLLLIAPAEPVDEPGDDE